MVCNLIPDSWGKTAADVATEPLAFLFWGFWYWANKTGSFLQQMLASNLELFLNTQVSAWGLNQHSLPSIPWLLRILESWGWGAKLYGHPKKVSLKMISIYVVCVQHVFVVPVKFHVDGGHAPGMAHQITSLRHYRETWQLGCPKHGVHWCTMDYHDMHRNQRGLFWIHLEGFYIVFSLFLAAAPFLGAVWLGGL